MTTPDDLARAAPHAPAIFHHLFARLPPPGSEFPKEQRLAFLRALAAVADVVYGPAPLRIEILPAAAETACAIEARPDGEQTSENERTEQAI
jgi:hypothetical protein